MKTIGLLCICILIGLPVYSQKEENLQNYTPSVLLSKGNWEFKSFNNIYTQTKSFDSNGKKVDNGKRETFYTMINQFLYGISPNINIGMDVWLKNSTKSEMDVNQSRWGITGVGPKIKIAPFKKLPGFSWQSTFLIPITKDLEGRDPNSKNPFLFLDWDRYLWMNQFFYDRQLNDKFQIFLQLSLWYSITRESSRESNFLETPISGFITWFPTTRVSIYFMSEYWPKHHQEPFFAYFIQSGLGGKYQLIPGLLELELLYTNFWAGSEGEGAGQTYNLGIRFIH